MEKKCKQQVLKKNLSKILLYMKLTMLLLMAGFVSVYANSYSQNTKLSLKLENGTLESLFDKIEDISDYYFFYKNDEIQFTKSLNLDVNNKRIDEILDGVLKGTDLKYKVMDRFIIVSTNVENEEMLSIREQVVHVSGKVTDSSGAPLPGVTVVLKGTTQGITTDMDGKYTLAKVPSDAILVFSFVGMKTQEIPVSGKTTINVVMGEDAIGIEEVVAIGYGTMKKSDLTGSVGSMKSGELVRLAPTQTIEALRGNIAGVNITQSNGKVGSDFKMTIRGMSSIDKSNTPLVVIDGAMGGDLNLLNPSDIETIDVLKDASACAIYGARGANGVLIITTKKGIKGKVSITYDGNVGFSIPVNTPEYMSVDQHEALLSALPEVGLNSISRTAEELYNLENGIYFDWFDAILQNGLKTEHTVSLSGGSENSNYYFSVGYSKNEGSVNPDTYNRMTLKTGIDSKINEKLSAGFSSYFTYTVRDDGSKEALRNAFRLRWTLNPYDSDGELTMTPSGYAGYGNPIMETQDHNYSDETRKQNFMGNVYLEYKPIKGLSLRSSLSAISNTQRRGVYQGLYTKEARLRESKVYAYYAPNQTASYTLDNIINYNWNKDKHKLNLNAINSISYQRWEDMYLKVKSFSQRTYWYALEMASVVDSYNSNFSEWSLVSYMGRANYSFNDKYLLTVTGRWDGSSKLAPGHKWDFFPSAALAWRVSDEPFIRDLKAISNLKLRLSYGEIGNDDISPYSTQALVTASTYSFGSGQIGAAPASLANSKLSWEHSQELNIGVEAGLFDNRISLTAELYNRKTNGLIVSRGVPNDSGFNTITGNFASTRNKGIELTLNTVNVSTKNFSWTTNINFAKNKNEILSLAEDGLTHMQGSENINGTYYREYIVGEDIMSHYFYEFDGIFQEGEETSTLAQSMYGSSAKAGWVKVKDQNGDGKITSDKDRKVLGTETPAWTGGMTNTITYKNWDFSFFLYTVQDVFVFDDCWHTLGRGDQYSDKRLSFIDYWRPSNPSNTWDSPTASDKNQYTWTKYFHNTSWVRLQNVTLGYTLPQSLLNRIKINRIRLYATTTNPLIFSDYKGKGFDPEWASKSTNGIGVSAATYIMGVNVTF